MFRSSSKTTLSTRPRRWPTCRPRHQNHIVGLFDNSDEDPSWATYIEQQKVPVFGNTDTPAGQDNPDFYPPGTTNRNLVVAEAVSLKRAHVKKLADLYCVEDPVCASSVPPLEAALKKEGYGTQIVYKSGITFACTQLHGAVSRRQAGWRHRGDRRRRRGDRDQSRHELRPAGL